MAGRRTIKHVLSYIFVPITFFVITYVSVYVCTAPILKMGASLLKIGFLDSAPTFDTEPDSIYTESHSNKPSLKGSEITFPAYGTHYGKVEIESLNISRDLYFGDGVAQLKKGLGHYTGSSFPGEGNTVMIAGHNNKDNLRTLGDIKLGDIIKITTNYGVYEYKVVNTRIAKESDKSAYDLNAGRENLILYTCYPFKVLGYYSDRFFVYAEYVSGPLIDKYH